MVTPAHAPQGGERTAGSGVLTGLVVRAVLVGAALCLARLAGPSEARAAVGDPPRINEVRFEGNERLSDRTLRGVMRLRPPSWWNPFSRPRYTGPDLLAGDLYFVLDRYRQEGYPFARIESARVRHDAADEAVQIEITVEEGPRSYVDGLLIRGVSAAWEKELREGSPLRPGRPLSLLAVRAERSRVADYLGSMGRPLGRADVVLRHVGDQAEIVIDVEPGPAIVLDSIRIEGLERMRETAVRRELLLAPGDLLSARQVIDSRDRLLETGVFRRVRILPEFADSSRPSAALRVSLEERRNGWLGAGFGYSSSDRVRFVSEWGIRNLDGTGRRLGVTGNLYYSLDPGFRSGGFQFREGRLQTDYLEPWLFGTRTRCFLSPYAAWLQEETFHQRTLGYAITLRRDLTRAARMSVGFESKHVATTEKSVEPRHVTRLVNLDAIDDRRDNIFDPAEGRIVEGRVEYAGGVLSGNNRFARFTAGWQGYTSPRRGWVVAARVRGGGIEPLGRGPVVAEVADTLRLSRVPWAERFRLGGGTTIRGFDENGVGRLRTDPGDPDGYEAIGGLAMILANLELRFPLLWLVKGGLFIDVGNVWASASELKWGRITDGFKDHSYDPLNLAYGMGGGIRITTPVGPFRFDYGFKVGSGRAPGEGQGKIHVALGQAF